MVLITCGPVDREIFLAVAAGFALSSICLILGFSGILGDPDEVRIVLLLGWVGVLGVIATGIQFFWFTYLYFTYGFREKESSRDSGIEAVGGYQNTGNFYQQNQMNGQVQFIQTQGPGGPGPGGMPYGQPILVQVPQAGSVVPPGPYGQTMQPGQQNFGQPIQSMGQPVTVVS